MNIDYYNKLKQSFDVRRQDTDTYGYDHKVIIDVLRYNLTLADDYIERMRSILKHVDEHSRAIRRICTDINNLDAVERSGKVEAINVDKLTDSQVIAISRVLLSANWR